MEVIGINDLGQPIVPAQGSVTNDMISGGAAIAQSKVNLSITDSEIASSLDLSAKTVTLPAASVTAHVTAYDDAGLRNDISTLALHSAIADNKAAYNLSNAFIDQFEDDTGIDTETTCDRIITGEYMASITDTVATADVGGTLTGVGDSNTYYSSSASNDTYGTGNDPGSGSYNYSWWTSSALLTGDCMWEIHGGNTTQATDTGAGGVNKWEWGVTSLSGGNADGDPTGAQQNTSLTASNADTHSSTAPFVFASSGGTGRTIVLKLGHASNSTTVKETLLDAALGWEVGESARFVRKDSTLYFQIDGVTKYTFVSGDFDYSGNMYGILGMGLSGGNFVDVNYRSGMTAVKGLTSSTVNATGNFVSAAQTASASVSKMGAVILYKNNAGTATLNTDLVLQLSSDGGSNYTTATLEAGGTFSSGISIAKVNGLTIGTSGTAPKYKISFANQASGTKETQVHGVALLY